MQDSLFADSVNKFLSWFGAQLSDDFFRAHKLPSMWFYVIIAAAPEIYNLAVTSGLITSSVMPEYIQQIMVLLAFFGGIARIIKHKKKEFIEEHPEVKAEKMTKGKDI